MVFNVYGTEINAEHQAVVAETTVAETLVTPISITVHVVNNQNNQIVGGMDPSTAAAPVGLTMVIMEGQTHVMALAAFLILKMIVVAKPA